jgi:methanogenic corrinoid protein MtbC1
MSTSAYGRGRSNASGGGEPPRLDTLPDEPLYDISTVVQELSVRGPVLRAWEQQLGLSSQTRDGSSGTAQVRRYSERELVALKWVRDQVLAGVSLREAAGRLLAAQRLSSRISSVSYPGSRSLGDSGGSLGQAVAPRQPSSTRPLQPNQDPWAMSARVPATTRRLAETDATGSSWHSAPGIDSLASGNWRSPGASLAGRPLADRIPPQSTQRAERDVSALAQPLLRAFAHFDTALANQVMDEALSQHSVETVCLRLLQPALARVGELWARHEMTIPEEHFAVNFARGYLFSVFHTTREPAGGPLVYVACGPREPHEIGALTLALFWRRAGISVVYLGQDIDGASLVQSILARRPALVALSITTPQRVRSLARLVRDIDQLPPPKPFITYGGTVFVRNPELQRKVHGVYLGDDAGTATWHVRRLLQIDHKPAT